ncbi:MAG: tetratricopeptide repeat protein [Steroidobacteraceae bacterium]
MKPILVLVVAAMVPAAALGSGGGSMNMPSMSSPAVERTPEDRAKSAYNAGVRSIRKADSANERADKETNPDKKAKLQERARDSYRKSLKDFESAIELMPQMFEAWNYIGYAKRNLGDYAGALEAYDQALTINPQYGDAIEYRGRAYLGLARVDDAKNAYLTLFASDRKLADKLLTAMKDWVGAQRGTTSAVAPATLDDLDKWISERIQIAGQTAGLTPDGKGTRWN